MQVQLPYSLFFDARIVLLIGHCLSWRHHLNQAKQKRAMIPITDQHLRSESQNVWHLHATAQQRAQAPGQRRRPRLGRRGHMLLAAEKRSLHINTNKMGNSFGGLRHLSF